MHGPCLGFLIAELVFLLPAIYAVYTIGRRHSGWRAFWLVIVGLVFAPVAIGLGIYGLVQLRRATKGQRSGWRGPWRPGPPPAGPASPDELFAHPGLARYPGWNPSKDDTTLWFPQA